MRQHGLTVDGIDAPDAVAHRRGGVTAPVGNGARAFRGLFEMGKDLSGIEPGVRAVVPARRTGGEALLGGPHVVGHHGNRAVQFHDLAHALHLERGRLVDTGQCAAEHRRGGDRGDLHAGPHDINAEAGAAIDLAGRVDATHRLADQAEILRVLQRHRGRDRQRGSDIDQFAVAGATTARCIDHHTIAGGERRGIGVPLLRRRLHQQHARGRTRLAHRLPRAADGGRAAGDLGSDERLGVSWIGWRMLKLHRIERHIKLFGDQLRDGGVGALAHLDLVHDQRDHPIATDADEGVRFEAPGIGRQRVAARQVQFDQQAAASGGAELQEAAPAQAGIRGSHVHVFLRVPEGGWA
jgi:hypothetical protein